MKKLTALLLCAALAVCMIPAASAADLVYFPEFYENVGIGMKPNYDWPAIGEDVVPSQTYFQEKDSWEDCLRYVELYIDILEETGEFEVVRPLSGRAGGDNVRYSADLRYTGSAEMQGTLKALRAGREWGEWGEYHISVKAERDASRPNAARRNSVTVNWDAALRPEGIDVGTGTKPVEDPADRPYETDNNDPSYDPEQEYDPYASREGEAATVVLAIGYNKMCVNHGVTQVDDKSEQVCPIAENNRTLVPVSRIVEAFGGESTWDAKTNNTTYTLGNCKVSHVIGTKDVLIQKGSQRTKKTMEVPSKAINNRTYVPVRYVLEGLGLWVGYEPNYQLVIVSAESQADKNLVKLEQSQLLFASEEVPDTLRHTKESYAIDGMGYTMEVGEALTLFNPYKSSGTYYAYTWDIVDGGELVKVDRNSATCSFYAKRPGTVTIRSHVDETWVLGLGSFRDNTVTYDMTITITPATDQGSGGGLMTWQPCDFCGGSGTMQVGGRTITCTKCLGQKRILQ